MINNRDKGISIIFPDGSYEKCRLLSETAVHDLGLDSVCRKLSLIRYERCRYKIDSMLKTKEDIILILITQKWMIQNLIREVHTLSV